MLPLAILLLAAALRFYRLDAQSFWNDEGNSARIAERTLDLILEGAAGDIHPPGYYLLLHYWRALFGQSEFALRSLSVLAGLALVVCTYLLGRRLCNESTGLMAAFLGAISPFAIYYSQEARMYALLAVVSAASTLFAIRHLQSAICNPPSAIPNLQSPVSNPHSPPGTRNSGSAVCNLQSAIYLVAYILTSAAGLYTHYAFPFVLLVHNAMFGLWWLTRGRRSAHRWRRLALWAGVQTAVGILYLPWLPTALRSTTGWPAAGQTHEVASALPNVLRVLSVGRTLPLEDATAALVGAGVLLLAGLWSIPSSPAEEPGQADRTGWLGVASLALYLLLPIALIFAFDLYKSAWLKFLVVVLPAFHILVAHGIETIAHIPTLLPRFAISNLQPPISNLQSAIRLLAVIFLARTAFPSLDNLYFNASYARDDYRQIAADIAALARPGDGIILNAPNQWEVLTYYYPDQDVHPAPYRPSPDRVEAFLTPLIERYRRLFVLYWGNAESDPPGFIETWLAAHTYKASDRWYGEVRLTTYGVASLPEEPTIAIDARFGEAFRLTGYALAGDPFAPGDVLPIALFWEAETAIPERYKVTVQLLDGTGQLVAQHDTEPGGGMAPTTVWSPGQVLADRHGVFLPPDLPPGRYTLIAGLYHVASDERLPVNVGGDYVILCDVEVKH